MPHFRIIETLEPLTYFGFVIIMQYRRASDNKYALIITPCTFWSSAENATEDEILAEIDINKVPSIDKKIYVDFEFDSTILSGLQRSTTKIGSWTIACEEQHRLFSQRPDWILNI